MPIDIKNIVKNLHPLEIRILLFYKKDDELTIEKVEKDLNFKPGNGNQALSWLVGKGLVSEVRKEAAIYYEITGLGQEWKEKGSPEERILELIRQRIKKAEEGPRLPEIAEALKMENKDIGSAFGSLSKLGVLSMDGDKKVVITLPLDNLDDTSKNPVLAHFRLIKGLLLKVVTNGGILAEASLDDNEKRFIRGIAKKRGAADAPFRQIDRETVFFGFTAAEDGSIPALEAAEALKAAGITGDEVGLLTPTMLETGSWKDKTFRSYNVKTPPVRLTPGRSNPYAKFLENVKDKLSSLGFEEFDGPLVETEFWNSDALFMPQFHSARDIHDAYSIADTGVGQNRDGVARAISIDEPWLSNVASAHENGGTTGSRGWNYSFDRGFTRRLILRS
ncbi:MAG: phenylalanine--tRNA ligase subunit alpha, partial [Treponema sp.]|nr:phenylalanine--tRNA ligase subunit alpha [Treponema sp.]